MALVKSPQGNDRRALNAAKGRNRRLASGANSGATAVGRPDLTLRKYGSKRGTKPLCGLESVKGFKTTAGISVQKLGGLAASAQAFGGVGEKVPKSRNEATMWFRINNAPFLEISTASNKGGDGALRADYHDEA
ncbi:MAG TPA: hypothetical protein VL523_09660 [Terriglobia bacterium]|nr:hypothetical protein [Terriglobia bacterium]